MKGGTCINPPVQLRHSDYTKNVYTWSEIKQHNNKNDCWLVAKGKVYDVTNFLHHHPAGVQSIARHGGTEASEHFYFHSKSAHTLWEGYIIGRLDGYKAEDNCTLM